MKKVPLNFYYIISKFEPHDRIKHEVLEAIDHEVTFNVKSDTTDIKTDWGSYQMNKKKRYYSYIEKDLESHMKKTFIEAGYADTIIHNYWFQQYYKGGKHGWHTHLACQWTNVYYLEFPEGAPRTEFKNPIDGTSIFVDVEEGDILSFPSLILHRAPEVEHDLRKTIISFNSDAS